MVTEVPGPPGASPSSSCCVPSMNSAAQVQFSRGNHEIQYSGRRPASNSNDSDVLLSSIESFDQSVRTWNVRKAQPVHRPARVRRRRLHQRNRTVPPRVGADRSRIGHSKHAPNVLGIQRLDHIRIGHRSGDYDLLEQPIKNRWPREPEVRRLK